VASVKNACAGPFGAAYDAWIEHERVARVVGRVVWGIDTRPMFGSIRTALASVPAGATVIDVPCGGGVAFRGLRPRQEVRYLAVDLDAEMLSRARRRATRDGLAQIEFVSADMRRLPLDDGAAELCLTYSGLHMIPDPDAALAELGRCLAPGGELVGSTFIGGGSRRKRLLFAAGARTGHANPRWTLADLERWLRAAGLTDIDTTPGGAFVLFTGRKRS
jgi:SAM-dependent methyltransferase